MVTPNGRLQWLREHAVRLSRHELAEQVNSYLWDTYSMRVELDANYIGKLERGVITWPGARYREALRAVLAAETDSDLGLRTRRSTAPGPAHGGLLSQLPAGVEDFTGRVAQVAELSAILRRGSPPVVVFGGPGIGKSTLAVHTARQLTSRFPDGQMYLDLLGTSDTPRDPGVLLAELLGALGVTGGKMPDGEAARAALFRSLTADLRLLLVLDDAADATQVTPLLPAGSGCATVVTSRRLLTDLVAARHVELDVLSEDEARQLFAHIIGSGRALAEPAELTALVRACAHLPLALRIAAGRLVGRPAWPLRMLRDTLADESQRLTELSLGGLSVRASFQASITSLPAEAVRAFQLLGTLGPHVLPGWVPAALVDLPTDDVLDTLVDANLLAQRGIDNNGSPRYRLHDLLRVYAVNGAEAVPVAERRTAVVRVLTTWLDLARRAVRRMPPSLFHPPLASASPTRLTAAAADRLVTEPLRWFDAERETLLGAVELAARWDLDELACAIAGTMAPYFDVRSRYEDWRRSHEIAIHAARQAGNIHGEAILLRGIAQIHIYRDEYAAATYLLRRSRRLCQQAGDKRTEGFAISGLGTVARLLGHHDQALGLIDESLAIAVTVDDRHQEAQLRRSRGMVLTALDRTDEALTTFDESLSLCRQLGDPHREAVVLRGASQLFNRIGEPRRAREALRRAVSVFEALDDDRCCADALLQSARLHTDDGRRAEAADELQRAATIYRRNGNRLEEAECRQIASELLHQQ